MVRNYSTKKKHEKRVGYVLLPGRCANKKKLKNKKNKARRDGEGTCRGEANYTSAFVVGFFFPLLSFIFFELGGIYSGKAREQHVQRSVVVISREYSRCEGKDKGERKREN